MQGALLVLLLPLVAASLDCTPGRRSTYELSSTLEESVVQLREAHTTVGLVVDVTDVGFTAEAEHCVRVLAVKAGHRADSQRQLPFPSLLLIQSDVGDVEEVLELVQPGAPMDDDTYVQGPQF